MRSWTASFAFGHVEGTATPKRSQRDSKVCKMAELKQVGDIMLARLAILESECRGSCGASPSIVPDFQRDFCSQVVIKGATGQGEGVSQIEEASGEDRKTAFLVAVE